MSFIYLHFLNINIMRIIQTQMSYVYSYCLDTNVVCLFMKVVHTTSMFKHYLTHKGHAHDFRV
jgi:hypothetical protein